MVMTVHFTGGPVEAVCMAITSEQEAEFTAQVCSFLCFFFFPFFLFFVFKVFIESVTIVLLVLYIYFVCLFVFGFFGPKACGNLAPPLGMEATSPALEVEILTTEPSGKSPQVSFKSLLALGLQTSL